MVTRRRATGSHALGAELRRLRGERTYRDVVELTSAEPLSRQESAVCEASISQVETATTMPALSTVHALARAYRVPIQHLLDVLCQESLAATASLPHAEAGAAAAYRSAAREGRWHEALSLALHAERLVANAHQRFTWRVRRGRALLRTGMRDEAIAVLMDCHEARDATPLEQVEVLDDLVEALTAARRFALARTIAGSGAALLAEVGTEARARHLARRGLVVVEGHDGGAPASEIELRQAQRDVQAARDAWPGTEPGTVAGLDVAVAYVHALLGNRLLAERDLEKLRTACEARGFARAEAMATFYLGLIALRAKRTAAARAALEHAASIASRLREHDLAYEAYSRLLALARADRDPDERRLLRRCISIHPLVTSAVPAPA
jgi:tetratricopeptide (TPR) repeat protein